MKKCYTCSEEKSLKEFNKRSQSKDGYAGSCRNCTKDRQRRYYKKTSGYSSRNYHCKTKYGMSLEDRNTIIENQKDTCPICNSKYTYTSSISKHSPCIDHCHESGSIRGIICSSCNLVLGKVSDDIEVLENMINYLRDNINNH